MIIQVNMAFDYGKKHFTSGRHECSDINVIRHMKRLGYGKVITSSFAKSEETVEIVEKKAEPKKPVEKKKAPVKPKKKAAKK